MSRSCRRMRFSLRSRASSTRSSVPSPSRSPASISACITHLRTAVSVRPKSRQTWPMDRSPAWHSSTTSALNSSVNERLFTAVSRFGIALVELSCLLGGQCGVDAGLTDTFTGCPLLWSWRRVQRAWERLIEAHDRDRCFLEDEPCWLCTNEGKDSVYAPLDAHLRGDCSEWAYEHCTYCNSEGVDRKACSRGDEGHNWSVCLVCARSEVQLHREFALRGKPCESGCAVCEYLEHIKEKPWPIRLL